MDIKIRDYFKPRFGIDLKDVRIHNNSNADRLARAIRAKAFTYGNNMVFAKNEYNPNTKSGKMLVAHELTHVIQQGRGIIQKQDSGTEPNVIDNVLKGIKDTIDKTIEDTIADWQKRIDIIEGKVKSGTNITDDERNFLMQVYDKIGAGGYLAGYPEAGALILRYIAPSFLISQFTNRDGKTKDKPYMIDSYIYKNSAIVQYAIEQMKPILLAQLKNNNTVEITSKVLSATKRNSNTEGNILKDGRLIAEQNNLRLKFADHRFILNAQATKQNNGKIKIIWWVLSKYDFSAYPCPYYSTFKVKDGVVLTIDDGLSHYIAEKGWAEEFYYKAEWKEVWNQND